MEILRRVRGLSEALTNEDAIISGEPIAALIVEELQAESDWRRSLEQRALSLFASAGLIGGLASVAAGGSAFRDLQKWLLGLGLGSLGVGALLGLVVAFPFLAPAVRTESLRATLADVQQWARPADAYLAQASEARLDMIDQTRRVNTLKARALRVGVGFAALGIGLLLCAVLSTLIFGLKPVPAWHGRVASRTAAALDAADIPTQTQMSRAPRPLLAGAFSRIKTGGRADTVLRRAATLVEDRADAPATALDDDGPHLLPADAVVRLA